VERALHTVERALFMPLLRASPVAEQRGKSATAISGLSTFGKGACLKRPGAFLVLSLLVLTGASVDSKKETERVENAGKVLKEILSVPDNRHFNYC
jgi:hypothetical protein